MIKLQFLYRSFSTNFTSALLRQVVCGQNCTFVIQPNGTVLACGEGSYGRLGQGNSDDLHVLTVISALQGAAETSAVLSKHTDRGSSLIASCPIRILLFLLLSSDLIS